MGTGSATAVLEHAGACEHELALLQSSCAGGQAPETHLAMQAKTDALTGHLNRHWLDEHQQQLLGCCVLMVDIHHFKRINEEYGHAVGDKALRAVAQQLRQQTRPGDVLVRLGGEGFAVICRTGERQVQIAGLAERLRQAVADLEFRGSGADPDSPPIQLSISVGVALSESKETLEGQLERADRAPYRAKGLGRDRVVIATDVIDQPGAQ